MSQTVQDPTARVADALNARLEEVAAHVRLLVRVRSISTALLVFALAMLLALLIDYLWELPLALRLGLLLGAVAATGWAWYRVLFPAGLRRLTSAEMAALVEQAHPGLNEQLLSTIELCDAQHDESYLGSAYMRDMLARHTLAQTVDFDMTESVSPKRALQMSMLCAVVMTLLLAPFMVVPDQYSLMVSRFFTPWRNHASPGNLDVDVLGGDRVVARGSDVTLQARVAFRTADATNPDALWLVVTAANGESDRRPMVRDLDEGTYTALVPHVFESFDFQVESGRNHSQTHHIKVVDPPNILAARLHIEPPAYTGRPAEVVDGVVGRIPVFAGSTLRLELEISKPLESGVWQWLEGASLAEAAGARAATARRRAGDSGNMQRLKISEEGTIATLDFSALRGGAFAFQLVDRDGVSNLEEPLRLLVLEADSPPELALAGNSQPVGARPGDVVELEARATDDVSLGALEMHYDVLNGPSGKIEVEQARMGVADLTHRFELDLATVGVEEGNVVTIRVRAADERPEPGPQEVWSGTRIVNVKQSAQPPQERAIIDRQAGLKQQLQELREAVEQDRQAAEGLEQAAREAAENEQEFPQAAEAAELARRERELAQRAEQLAQQFTEAPLYESLAQPAQQVARDRLPEIAKELAESARAELQKQPEMLKQAAEGMAEVEQALEALEERFDALAQLEQDLLELGRLAQQAQRLAESTERLQQRQAAAAAQQDAPVPADEARALDEAREALQAEQGQLVDDLEELLDRRPEVMDAARRAQLERLAELGARAEQLAEPQEQLAASIQAEPQPDNADANANNAAPAPANLEPTAEEARQSQLAQRAAETAVQTARATGINAEPARQAASAAARSTDAARAAFLGQLPEAAQAAAEAAQAWEQLNQQLQPLADDANAAQAANQASQLAAQQRELAEEFGRQAQLPAQRSAAQQRGQQRLEGMTAPVAQELSEVAAALEAEPVSMPAEAQRAGQAQVAAGQAQQSMQRAAEELAQQRASAAGNNGAEAAKSLREAAAAALGTAAQREQIDSPVPDELGTEVATAAQQLAAAQQQLAQMGEQSPPAGQSPAQGGSQSQSQAGESSPASTQAGAKGEGNQQPGQQPGQQPSTPVDNPAADGSLSQAAKSMQQASQALASAAQQMQQGTASGNAQASGAQSQNESAGMGGSAGKSGSGATALSSGDHLEAQLQRLQMRQWGALPGLLETEILDSARKRPHGEYGRLIKLYFEEIARPGDAPQPSTDDTPADPD